MTPLTVNPRAVVLVDPQGKPIATATNVAPDLEIIITNDRGEFENEAAGMPFDTTRPPTPQQTLSSAASKARYAKAS
jgi:hypothetical protein